VPLQDRVEVCEPLMAVGLSRQFSPVVGEMARVRLTVPVNPFRLLSEMIVVAMLLASIV
jgi:hypothetical protein